MFFFHPPAPFASYNQSHKGDMLRKFNSSLVMNSLSTSEIELSKLNFNFKFLLLVNIT
jgi:hypothetical protein